MTKKDKNSHASSNENKKKKKSKKKTFRIILFCILGAALITFFIYAYYFSWWAYLPFKINEKQYNSVFSANTIPEVVITPNPTSILHTDSPSDLELETNKLISNPEVIIHPGIRDNKFIIGDPIFDDMSYYSQDLSIEINRIQNDTITCYVAEVYFRNNENIFSGLSNSKDDDSTQIVSEILANSNGVFAVNADFYNSRYSGIVIRNKEILVNKENRRGVLSFFDDGSLKTISDNSVSGESLLESGAMHTYYFGPILIEKGKAIDNFEDTVRLELRQLHPRCAVGTIEPYHHIFVIVDGRTPGYSQGVTMIELAKIMEDLGCVDAYNLDGGGSASMVFMGNLINKPLGRDSQREVSDAIVVKEIVN